MEEWEQVGCNSVVSVFKTRNGEMTEWHLTMWDTVNPFLLIES